MSLHKDHELMVSAVLCGCLDTMNRLLDEDLTLLHSRSHVGFSWLNKACECAFRIPETIHLLVDRGLSVNELDGRGSSPAWSAIHDVTAVEALRTLLALGADPDFTRNGGSLLHGAMLTSGRRGLEMVTMLLHAGANPNVVNSSGMTPLHMAARFGDFNLAQLLLSAGSDPDIRTPEQKTALAIAQEEGRDGFASRMQSWLQAHRALRAVADIVTGSLPGVKCLP